MDIEAPRFTAKLAKELGKILRQCSCLEEVTLKAIEISPEKQVMKFKEKHLLLDSVSEEFLTMMTELKSEISEKV